MPYGYGYPIGVPPPAYQAPGMGWLPAATMAAGLLAAARGPGSRSRSTSRRRGSSKPVRPPPRKGIKKARKGRSGRFGKRRRVKSIARDAARKRRKIIKAVSKTVYQKLNFRDIFFNSINRGGDDSGTTFATANHNRCQWFANLVTRPSTLDQLLKIGSNEASAADATWNQPILMNRAKLTLRLKCNHSTPSEITVWTCWPRKNIRQEMAAITGANPAALVTEVGEIDGPVQTEDVDMNMYDATPFDNPGWCSKFKLKQRFQKCLEPGEEVALRFYGVGKKAGPKYITKRQVLDAPSSTFSADYRMIKGYGPLVLIRARGCLAHDESKVPAVGTTYDMTDFNAHYTGFNIDCAWHWEFQCTKVPDNHISSAVGRQNVMPNPVVTALNSEAWLQPAAAEAKEAS